MGSGVDAAFAGIADHRDQAAANSDGIDAGRPADEHTEGDAGEVKKTGRDDETDVPGNRRFFGDGNTCLMTAYISHHVY